MEQPNLVAARPVSGGPSLPGARILSLMLTLVGATLAFSSTWPEQFMPPPSPCALVAQPRVHATWLEGDVATLASPVTGALSSVQALPGRVGHRLQPLASRFGRRVRPATRAHARTAVDELVASIRTVASYAHVTSDFNDFRGGSRLIPGRHGGYDVGLDAGTPVPVPWAGKVTKITQWWGCEHAITVTTGGIEVTYGHLVPSVREGQVLRAGDVVGRVAYDHVDVKMMIADELVDFGTHNPFADEFLAGGACADERISACGPRSRHRI